MKRYKSLRFNVTLKFLLVILILSTLLLIFLPLGLKNFFLEESYKTIERSQIEYIKFHNTDYSPDLQNTAVNPKAVNHIFIEPTSTTSTKIESTVSGINLTFLQTAYKNALNQEDDSQRYLYQDPKSTIYYVITKNNTGDVYLVSFVYGTYVNYYIHTLYNQLLLVILVVVILSLIIAVYFSNSITQPLIMISKKIKSISKDNWDDEIKVTREDEIGEIQIALEEMRNHLKTQDRIEREMFQNISHDLKTPIMIIEGYSQSILDGYVSTDQLNDVTISIMEEAKRLEKKVKGLLYINKIEQMQLEHKAFSEIDVTHLFHTVILPFETRFNKINFILDIKSQVKLKGEFESWRVALENIVDNMTRFAKSEIRISYMNDTIRLFNDGEPIEESLIDKLFVPFGVGKNSNFGLGLSITYKIISMYGYQIQVLNHKNGVEFKIKKMDNHSIIT